MPTPLLTVDELVATVKRSHLPTVLVEGGDDVEIYRWIEAKLGVHKANFLPCGGRDALLQVYNRRQEFSHVATAFVADRDMWLFTGIPPQFNGIIWTSGYSVENDLCAGARLEGLLDEAEAKEHAQVLQSIIEWFAFEVEEYRSVGECQASRHSQEVVVPGTTHLCAQFLARRGFRNPRRSTVRHVRSNYKLKIRGKTLFELLTRYLSASKRRTKHSVRSLCEVAFKGQPSHKYMDRFLTEIEQALNASSSTQATP